MANRPSPAGKIRVHLAALEGARAALAWAESDGRAADAESIRARMEADRAEIRRICARWGLELPPAAR